MQYVLSSLIMTAYIQYTLYGIKYPEFKYFSKGDDDDRNEKKKTNMTRNETALRDA